MLAVIFAARVASSRPVRTAAMEEEIQRMLRERSITILPAACNRIGISVMGLE
jgi:hypothetical protein